MKGHTRHYPKGKMKLMRTWLRKLTMHSLCEQRNVRGYWQIFTDVYGRAGDTTEVYFQTPYRLNLIRRKHIKIEVGDKMKMDQNFCSNLFLFQNTSFGRFINYRFFKIFSQMWYFSGWKFRRLALYYIDVFVPLLL